MKFPLLNLVAYVCMVVVSIFSIDALSHTIPGKDRAQIELMDKLDTMLAPLSPYGFTLSVWILIYGLLLIFVTISLIYFIGKSRH